MLNNTLKAQKWRKNKQEKVLVELGWVSGFFGEKMRTGAFIYKLHLDSLNRWMQIQAIQNEGRDPSVQKF